MGLKEMVGRHFEKQEKKFIPQDLSVQERAYFRGIKDLYPEIKRIYYPGVGNDERTFNGLDNEFKIVTLDHESGFVSFYRDRDRLPNYVRGDASQSPFKDDAFDALFIQDIDTTRFGDAFRTLKTGGLFIFSGIDCGPMFNFQHTDFDNVKNLERLEGPKTNLAYYLFRKTGLVTQEDLDAA